ncbi:carboxylesterase/lipase family protein [Brevibacterium litoralis]|uniref:carboxylesterase/lipase family protein n=1 Tax=Brevibacterium litoralis TaxID=3138935 RepID=UPI0032ED3850
MTGGDQAHGQTPAPTVLDQPTLDLAVTGGTIRGRTGDDDVARFLGIPYAAPPFGPHRLLPPAPVEPWEGVREAFEYGPTVPKIGYDEAFQRILREVEIPGTECLNLNVWAPAGAVQGSGEGDGAGASGAGAALPVFVWIHGGAFLNGSGAIPTYDGTAFARDGVVTVTLNYRLGSEGFLYTPDAAAHGSANLGLQDQVAALRWVQENIAAFGGDPERVTIGGESAGAMSVATLLAMPSAQGLFAQAITESGAASHTLDPAEALKAGELFARHLGTDFTQPAIAGSEVADAVVATGRTVLEIRGEQDPGVWGKLGLGSMPFAPVVDGTVVPSHPLDAYAAGASAEVPVLSGYNLQEYRFFMVAPGMIEHIRDEHVEPGSAKFGLGPAGVQAYRETFPEGTPGDVYAQIVGDWFFTLPAVRMSEARHRAGATSWHYRFDVPDPAENNGFGAAHAVEIPFVFKTHRRPGTEAFLGADPSDAVADNTHDIWVRFITTGEPGWEPYSPATRTTALLTDTTTPVEDPHARLRTLWDGVR